MSYINKPKVAHPSLPTNSLGMTRRQYEGSMSTLCAGCGHDSVTASIIEACWGLSLRPEQLVKLSGALQNVGNGRALLLQVLPGPLQTLIPKVIAGANNALALSIGDLFWITIVAGVIGLVCTLILRDLPLSTAAELRSVAATQSDDERVAVVGSSPS